jgi:glycosyltransferase involved in cell wall biosynthesis
MRVAIVHDYLTQPGGAERVVLSLSRLFPEAPIFTSVFDPGGTHPEFADRDVRATFLQRLPHAGGEARRLLPLYPIAFESLRLRGYDLVISSSSGWAHGVRAGSAFHLSYCYTPARWLYRAHTYFAPGAPVPPWSRHALRPVLHGLRRWDRAAARRPDTYVAMTPDLADRIAAAYGRTAEVVAPPVDLARIRFAPSAHDRPYALVVARLLAYKRVDLAIRACAKLRRHLVVVGTGPAEPALRGLAESLGASVSFRGRVSEDELNGLLHGCTSVIQPGEEDFGLAPLEANAAGRPAVAYGAGGARSTVIDGKTGVLFHEQSVEALVAALHVIDAVPWDWTRLRDHAERFDEPTFHDNLLAVLAEHGVESSTAALAS